MTSTPSKSLPLSEASAPGRYWMPFVRAVDPLTLEVIAIEDRIGIELNVASAWEA